MENSVQLKLAKKKVSYGRDYYLDLNKILNKTIIMQQVLTPK